MSGIASMSNTYGLPGNPYGMIDKTKQAIGMSEVDLKTSAPLVSERAHLNIFDTRNCIGELSLREAQLAFSFHIATEGKIPPEEFKKVLLPDGQVSLERLLDIVEDLDRRKIISGFPSKTGNDGNIKPYIEGNKIRFNFDKKYKLVKSLELINVIIPRDIIPMYIYFPGFVENCLPFTQPSTGSNFINPLNSGPSSIWDSPIPPEVNDFINPALGSSLSATKLGGVFQTPLRYWRSYTGPNSMPNPQTPPPYQLWNPPQNSFSEDPWPFQPQPIRQQRIPTYRAKNGVVFAGYGLYDLEDFPSLQQLQLADGTIVQIPLRKLILKLIIPEGQFINNVSADALIDISKDDDFNDSGIVDNSITQTGYGDYQRFIPGPGLGMNYQPNQYRAGKSAVIDLSLSTYDSATGILGPMPVPFPNYRGNVWGPYGRPGDRFQNTSLQSTVDELYLNSDLSNLSGNPIIFPNYDPRDSVYTFEMFSLMTKRPNDIIRFQNFETSSSPNIKNSMRIVTDGGFGAVFAYVGKNTSAVGTTGPIVTGGLPNTQYDGNVHALNPDVWVTPPSSNPTNWLETLPGPQRPTIVSDENFNGWLYIWRDIYPWTGEIYVPTTAGGVGTMSHFDGSNWVKTISSSSDINFTAGSSMWASSPVIGQSSSWCFPTIDNSFPSSQTIGNLPWGQVNSITLSTGGTNYIQFEPDGITPIEYEFMSGSDTIRLKIDTIDPVTGAILTFTLLNAASQFDYIGTIVIGSSGTINVANNATITIPSSNPGGDLTSGGSRYSVADNVTTATTIGSGSELTIEILSVGSNGEILSAIISNAGTGYVTGDVVTVEQTGSDLNATFTITDAEDKGDQLIPEYNIFHYMDPLAVGPSQLINSALVTTDYKNGIDACMVVCEDENDDCGPPAGKSVFAIGSSIGDTATAYDDPTPTPDPPKLLKCDFRNLESPETEWDESEKNCRPKNNTRERQRSVYIDRRVSYNDMGPNGGGLISALLSYRSFFISSTPDTDFIIRITNADRSTYVQSINSNLSASNFYTPIRLDLGSAAGTQNYVEATLGTLTGSSRTFWIKTFEPPLAELNYIEMEFLTFNGTPIPIERSLGFLEQFKGFSSLFTATISSALTYVGSYDNFQPNLPPFIPIITTSPSSVIVTAVPNSKSLSDPFSPYTEAYTQRNLGIVFKIDTYHAENPGINPIIKTMPGHETFESASDEDTGIKLIPMASNIDKYGI
jgi:hypothetical protein